MRDRASYVLEQGDVRFVVTSALREDHEITRHQARHGDGVREIALTVPDATQAYGEAVQRGARGVIEPKRVEDEFGSLEVSAIATYGDTLHTFVDRADYGGPLKPGYTSVSSNGHANAGVGLTNIDHVVGNVELGRMDHWVEFYERVFGMTNILHFGDEPDPDRVLRADVEGHVGRRPQGSSVADQRAGRGQAQEPDRRVPRLSTVVRARSTSRSATTRHRRHGATR